MKIKIGNLFNRKRKLQNDPFCARDAITLSEFMRENDDNSHSYYVNDNSIKEKEIKYIVSLFDRVINVVEEDIFLDESNGLKNSFDYFVNRNEKYYHRKDRFEIKRDLESYFKHRKNFIYRGFNKKKYEKLDSIFKRIYSSTGKRINSYKEFKYIGEEWLYDLKHLPKQNKNSKKIDYKSETQKDLNNLFDEVISIVLKRLYSNTIKENAFEYFKTRSKEYFSEEGINEVKNYLTKYFKHKDDIKFRKNSTYNELTSVFRKIYERSSLVIDNYDSFMKAGKSNYKVIDKEDKKEDVLEMNELDALKRVYKKLLFQTFDLIKQIKEPNQKRERIEYLEKKLDLVTILSSELKKRIDFLKLNTDEIRNIKSISLEDYLFFDQLEYFKQSGMDINSFVLTKQK